MPTVAALLIEGLRHAGVPRFFAPSRTASESSLVAAALAGGLCVVVAQSASAASLMAAVTGELTGAPGVVLLGPGAGPPGAAPAIEYARLDRAPLILIIERPAAGSAPPSLLQTTGVIALVKEFLTVTSVSASHWIAHAVHLTLKEPRGPVHLDLTTEAAGSLAIPVAARPVPLALAAPDPAALDATADVIQRADRPLVIAGLGCRTMDDSKWLRAFAEALPAPVLTTRKAKGVMPELHPLAFGILANGDREDGVLTRADLVIAMGLDSTEVEPTAWSGRIPMVHLARGPLAENAFAPTLEVVGEPGSILEELALRLRGRARADWDVGELDRLKRERASRMAGATPAARRIVEIARESSPAGTIAVVDPGPLAGPATWFWPAMAPHEFLIPSGSAMGGFALPAAIAAQLVYPERRVLCFTGVAGLLGAVAELETASRLRTRIVAIVGDETADSHDIAVLAKRYDLAADEAADEASTRRALAAALTADRTVLVHLRTG